MKKRTMTRSYKELRVTVGLIGILLPLALAIGHWGLMPSISQFYYTDVRNILVGALSAVGTFMFFYVGYDKTDSWVSNFLAIFAIGIAFFPCEGWTRIYHLMSAVSFFTLIGYFSIFRFTKGTSNTFMKNIRNKLYISLGIVIWVSLIAIIFVMGFKIKIPHFTFWMETIMLEAFGVSWLVKGGYVFKDKLKQ